MIPVSASPLPAVAIPQLPVVLSVMRPSGAAITVQPVLVGECMITVPLTEGEHIVSFAYRNKAFQWGWKITLVSGLAFAGLIQLYYKPDWKRILAEQKKKWSE